MPIPDHNLRIVIVGASSPRGRELRDVLEEHGFSAARFRLFDEDISVGTLTRSGDEPAIIEAVDEESFAGAGLVFFAGRAEMASRHAGQALEAGARVIDLSEDPGLEDAVPWIPALDGLVGRPEGIDHRVLRSPSAAAIVAYFVLPIAFSLFHATNIEDASFMAITGAPPIWNERWQARVDPFSAAGWEMVFAGALNLVVAGALGDYGEATWTARGMAAIAYLIVFGSWVGFSAYIWLLQHVPMPKVATYAYVNPVVAVFLGWLILHEQVDAYILAGSATIVVAVALTTSAKVRTKAGLEEPEPELPAVESV